MRFLTAWVRIPHLSVEYFDKDFLQKNGGKIGKVTRIDHNTAVAQRGQFTRLSVELDLSKPLLSKFSLKGKIWKVQYEGLRMICFSCGKIGHQGDNCPGKNSVQVDTEEAHNMMEDDNSKNQKGNSSTIMEDDFGS